MGEIMGEKRGHHRGRSVGFGGLWVCVCGFVGLWWVCGSVGLQVCGGFVGLWLCESVLYVDSHRVWH